MIAFDGKQSPRADRSGDRFDRFAGARRAIAMATFQSSASARPAHQRTIAFATDLKPGRVGSADDSLHLFVGEVRR
jgi:hypothetical protein